MENTIEIKFKKGDKAYVISGSIPDIIDVRKVNITNAGEENQFEWIMGKSRMSKKEVQYSSMDALYKTKDELLNDISKSIDEMEIDDKEENKENSNNNA